GSDGDSESSGEAGEPGTAEIQGADGTVEVAAPIAEKYQETGGAEGHLGQPVGDQEQAPDGGFYEEFQGATIYWTPETDAHFVQGRILDAWQSAGGVEALGYPTSDEHPIDDGLQSDFQKGHITFIDDETE